MWTPKYYIIYMMVYSNNFFFSSLDFLQSRLREYMMWHALFRDHVCVIWGVSVLQRMLCAIMTILEYYFHQVTSISNINVIKYIRRIMDSMTMTIYYTYSFVSISILKITIFNWENYNFYCIIHICNINNIDAHFTNLFFPMALDIFFHTFS